MAAERPTRSHRSWNPLRIVVDGFSSISLGIFWIAAILIYGTLGSAVPRFRQFFELTEFQYFNHWVFLALIVLFCINLSVVTLRRIRFNLRNLGVLTVHAGLLILCGGSIVYFGHKVEGAVWLDAPNIRVVSLERLRDQSGNALLDQFVAVEGKVWERNIPMLGGRHRIEVTEVEHSGLKTAFRVSLKVSAPGKPEHVVELQHNTPEKPQGRIASLTDRLALMLTPSSSPGFFYDDTTPALIVQAGHAGRETFDLPELPYYVERFVEGASDRSDSSGMLPPMDGRGKAAASKRNRPIPLLEQWRMPIPLGETGSAIAADWPITMRIDGYLPYAELQPIPMPGGEEIRPIARVEVGDGDHRHEDWLIAHMPEKAMVELHDKTSVEFRWIGEETEIPPAWRRPIHGRHYLEVYVRDQDVRQAFDVETGQTLKIEGTDYTLKVEELRPSWPLRTAGYEGARTPIALVWIESPAHRFQRSVLQRFPELNQDRDRAGKKILEDGGLVDPNIEISYTDASHDHYLIVAGSRLSPTVIHTATGGARSVALLQKGKPYAPGTGGKELTLVDYLVRPRFESRPRVIPERDRRSLADVRRTMSAVRVHLEGKDGAWSCHVWVPFSDNNTRSDGTLPTVVRDIPGMEDLSLIYGRAERRLPTTLCLERLHTEFYPGREQPREWTSYFRYTDPKTRRVMRAKAFLNNTFTIGDWTLFQSSAARDHESFTVLGVGNRRGIWPMMLGCTLITIGMIYAFFIKPILVRRRKQRFATDARMKKRKEEETMNTTDHSSTLRRSVGKESITRSVIFMTACVLGVSSIARGEEVDQEPQSPAADLVAIQNRIDIESLGAIALLDQQGWRHTTVESWCRKVMNDIHGSKALYGLDPVTAAMELIFNTEAYHDLPVLYIEDKGILRDLTKHPIVMTDEERRRIFKSRSVSYEFLTRPAVRERLSELSGQVLKSRAMGRVSEARYFYENLAGLLTIVPHPRGDVETPWLSVLHLLDDAMRRESGITQEQAGAVIAAFRGLQQAWLDRDAEGINKGIASLTTVLPTLAPAGVYPSLDKRRAEVTYRRLNLIKYGWVCYIFAFFVSIFAVATRYRWTRRLGLLLLVAAVGLHGYDLWLRWGVIGRIPVANMYEAVVSSTWVGVVFALLLELFTKKRVYLLSAGLLGFFALSLPELMPDQINNKLVTMMPILDDIMLRIHTVLIISSYAVITLAWGVANCYLFVSAVRERSALAQGTIGAQVGVIACLLMAYRHMFEEPWAAAAWLAGKMGASSEPAIITGQFIFTLLVAIAGCAWIGVELFRLFGRGRPAGAGGLDAADFPVERGGGILEEFDRSHRVLIYTASVALFVGIVLGAMWADYSWGRPWGWDPKEVFALNTWLVYAILIHARFVTKRRALWTSVLSVVGFAAMQFNWWVVNFYIVGLHSYA